MSAEQFMIPCMYKKFLGIDCPGCGTQRSFVLLLQGEFEAAFAMFPAIYTTILLALALLLHFVDKKNNYHLLIRVSAIVNAVIMAVAYIYKTL